MAAAAAPPAAPKTDAAGIVPPAQVPASSVSLPVDGQGAKPGSAKEAMFKTLREKYTKPEEGQAPPAPPAAKPPEAPPKPPEGAPKPGEGAPKPAEGEIKPAEGAPTEGERKEKPTRDFWRAFDSWKERATKAESQIVDLQKGMIPEAERKSFQERLEKSEARNKELEDHIRFVDYRESSEFKEKYEKPYMAKWNQAMMELSQLTIKDPETDTERQVKVEDLSAIVFSPLGKARSLAEELFGPFADDVMNYRKEILNLNEAQAAALAEAKKAGAERQKTSQEQAKKLQTELQTQISTVWKKANDAALANETYGKWFQQVEGDKEINQRLAKGFELVDRAFSENPADPKLSPDERASVIKRHAAVRNRAAAFGRMVYEVETLRAKLAEVEKKLAGFQGSVPPTGGAPSGQAAAAGGELKGMERIRSGLQKIAITR